MADENRPTLRQRLRQDTSLDHKIVDDLFGTLQLGSRSGFVHFASAQLLAYRSLLDAEGFLGRAANSALIEDFCRRLEADLAAFGDCPPLSSPLACAGPLHAEAVDYVILGSRMGSRILRKCWLASSDPLVGAAGAYFSAPQMTMEWQELCARLAGMPARSPTADRIVRSAREIFTLFQAAFHITAGSILAGSGHDRKAS